MSAAPRVLFAGGGTGGHLYPALALADALAAERPGTACHFVGARRGVEARVLPQRGVPHTLLDLRPIHRDRVWRNVTLPFAMGRALVGLNTLFRDFCPSLVVGTGGYASGPAGAWAVLRGVPLALQEQNSWPGFTTRMLSRRARQVHLGFPEAEKHLSPGERTEVLALGNPIAPPDRSLDRAACRRDFDIPVDATVVLVIGGSQGARSINEKLLEAVRDVSGGRLAFRRGELYLVWATGPAHIHGVQQALEPLDAPWVRPIGYIENMPRALAAADLAVSRAGAMGTAELEAWGIPMILVPLPTAAADHQTHNARALEEAGAAVMLTERELTAERLWSALTDLAGDAERRTSMAAAARQRARPDAARQIARRFLELVDAP
ncbi:MAG: undecaprenyldiphospho-muramoylpentapeptide beta-N-acetylglucosaminyltransferase [Gemmatimonadota bacterium]